MWWSFWTEFEGLTQVLEQMNVKGGKWESEQETADFRGSSSLQCGPQQPGAPRKSGNTQWGICPGVSSLDFLEGWWFVEYSWLLSSGESSGRAYTKGWTYPGGCRREHLGATLNVTHVAIIFLTLCHICCPVGWCLFLPVHDVFSVLGTLNTLLVFSKPEVIGLGPDSLQNWNGSIGLRHWKMPGCDRVDHMPSKQLCTFSRSCVHPDSQNYLTFQLILLLERGKKFNLSNNECR